MKPNEIWTNLAVADLERATHFYTGLGFPPNGSSKQLTSFLFGGNGFIVHFFMAEILQDGMKGAIANLKHGNETIFTLSADSKEKVDTWKNEVKNAGGTIVSAAEEFGQGY